jgi:hypothetical protein
MTDDVFGKASVETFVTGVAANGTAIVAVGIDAGSDPVKARAWYSASEGDWGEAKVELAGHGQLFGVTPVKDGFLAVGPSDRDSCRGGIWSSQDGSSWRCIAKDRAMDGFGPSAVGVSRTVEIAVGLTSKGYDEESPDGLPGAAWWRPVQ